MIGRENRYKMIIAGIGALLLMQGCTMSDTLPVNGSGGGGDDGAERYAITFAPLTVDEGGEETRAAELLAEGKLRLVVYDANADLAMAPTADLLYTVKKGVLALEETPTQEPLKLTAGNYHFYALVPSDKLAPKSGVTPAVINHGDDPLASRTLVTVTDKGAYVLLNSLKHKTSRVEFILTRGEKATYKTLEQPTQIVLYSQTNDPEAFTLGEGGGDMPVPDKAGTDTICMKNITPFTIGEEPQKETFRAERLVLPRPKGDFLVAISTKIDKGDDKGPQPCTLRGRVYDRMFDPGRYYHFRLVVDDPAEGGEIVLLVTDWNDFGWDEHLGGSGSYYITVGKWEKITYNDDIG